MKNHALLLAAPFALTAALFVLLGLALTHGWFGPASSGNRFFCEYARAGLIREPVNTISNLGFVVSGLTAALLLWSGRFQKNRNPLTQNPLLAVLFCSLPVLLGFGSAAMHGSETDFGGELDLLGMYMVAGFIVAYAMRRYFGWRWGGFAVAFAASVLFCEAVGQYRQPVVPVLDYSGDAAFGLLVALAVFFETLNALVRKVKRENKWGVYALLAFLTAFAIWNFGKSDCPFCRPDDWLQAHAIWHLLFALALFFVFRLYVSEDTPYRRKVKTTHP